MRKTIKMFCAVIICVCLCVSMLTIFTGCGKNEETIKIGVLVADDTGSEALAFRSYYENYIAENYNVQFIYSTKCEDAAGEKAAMESFAVNNCKAIISFSSSDRPAQIEFCEKNKIYYAVATGTLTDEQYETYKSYKYYVGAIGPDNMTEYQAGYSMAKYYLDNGKTKFAMFGGATPYYTEMHIYRAAGMLAAMAEKGGSDYKGQTGMGIVDQIYSDSCIIDSTYTFGTVSLTAYVGGYNFDDAWFGALGAAATTGAEVCLAVGSGETAFAGFVQGSVTYGDIDAYTDTNKANFEAGKLSYMAGKFASSIGPIFIATLSAVQGKAIRTSEDYALALSQGYWVATDSATFNKYLESSSSTESPAYTKAILDKYIGASYSDFSGFVAKYSYDEISSLNK